MPSDRKPSVIVPVAVVVLLAVYVAAYYAAATPFRLVGRIVPVYSPPWDRADGLPKAPGGTHTFFAPIHWLDRRIRPGVWETTP
jgi:hypothetical protein